MSIQTAAMVGRMCKQVGWWAMSSIVHCIRASLCVILMLGASSATAESPVCGDGYLLAPESCDDGNTINELCPYGVGSCAKIVMMNVKS